MAEDRQSNLIKEIDVRRFREYRRRGLEVVEIRGRGNKRAYHILHNVSDGEIVIERSFKLIPRQFKPIYGLLLGFLYLSDFLPSRRGLVVESDVYWTDVESFEAEVEQTRGES